jgi:hypothetical protein
MKPRFAVRAVSTLRVSYPVVEMSVTVEDHSRDALYELEVWADVTEGEVTGTAGLDVDHQAQLAAFWFVVSEPALIEWAFDAVRPAGQLWQRQGRSATVAAC